MEYFLAPILSGNIIVEEDMDSEERLAVIEKQQRLARGEDPSQRIIDVARVVQFADVCLSPDGMTAEGTLYIDREKIPGVSMRRDQSGSSVVSLPSIPFRIVTYPAYILSEPIVEGISELASQILPPVTPLGRNPETGVITTAASPTTDRIKPKALEDARRRIQSGTFVLDLAK